MWKKLITLALLFTLALGMNIRVKGAINSSFTVTDGKTDLTYTALINGDTVKVSCDSEAVGSTYAENITACSVYGDIITFYSVDIINSAFTVYFCDFKSNSIKCVAINTDAFNNSNCFTADARGCVYFVSAEDTSKLCIYEKGAINEVKLNSQITQLLCVDGENIITVTTDYTYLYGGNEDLEIIGSPMSVPAYYTGGGVIEDFNGNKYIYENGNIEEKTIATETAPISTRTATYPQVVGGVYVGEIGVAVSKIKKAFADLEVTEVRKADGDIIESGKVGTGARVILSTGEEITVIIYGEVTGEGNVNSRDLTAVLNHLSDKELLSGAASAAADVDKDGKVTTKDALKIALMY